MKKFTKWFQALAMVCGTSVVWGSPEISNVKIRQRYPWNGKVDISFAIESTRLENSIRIDAVDGVRGTSVGVRSLYGDDGSQMFQPLTLGVGSHHLVWDAGRDIPEGFTSESLSVSIRVGNFVNHPKYVVIDLSGGASAIDYPVEYLDAVPPGGWTKEHKTTKLVLQLIQPGVFMMGPGPGCDNVDAMQRETYHQVTLTKPFYIGVFEVTQKQWYSVMGVRTEGADSSGNPYWKDGEQYDTYSVPRPSYYEIRGNSSLWPITAVDNGCFISKLRQKTGLVGIDLPSEAEWEFACRAGTTTQYYHGSDVWDGRYDGPLTHCEVGSKLPNAWGLYDFCSGGAEWCGDYWTWNLGTSSVIDPLGAATSTYSVTRGHRVVVHSRFESQRDRGGNDAYYQTVRLAMHLDR